MELTPREKDKLLIFTAGFDRNKGASPLVYPPLWSGNASWN